MVSVSWITPMTLALNQKHLKSKVSFSPVYDKIDFKEEC